MSTGATVMWAQGSLLSSRGVPRESSRNSLPEAPTEPPETANSDTQCIYWSIRLRLSRKSVFTSTTFTKSGQYSQPGAQWRQDRFDHERRFRTGSTQRQKVQACIEGRDAAPRIRFKVPGIGRTGRAPRAPKALPKSMVRALGLESEDGHPNLSRIPLALQASKASERSAKTSGTMPWRDQKKSLQSLLMST